jgi:arginine decarboxylase
MHNLFGDTNSADVSVADDGTYLIQNVMQGDTVDDVLRYVKYEPEKLLDSFHENLTRTDISDADKTRILTEVSDGLQGYTYLES